MQITRLVQALEALCRDLGTRLCSRRDIYIVNTELVNFHKVYHLYVYATGLIGGREVVFIVCIR